MKLGEYGMSLQHGSVISGHELQMYTPIRLIIVHHIKIYLGLDEREYGDGILR